MIDNHKKLCREFSQLIFGKLKDKDEVEKLMDCYETFGEFRVAFILKYEDSVIAFRKIASKWRDSIRCHQVAIDANDLTRTMELLSLRQSDIEQSLRESTALMLDKFKEIDTLTTLQINMRDRLIEMQNWITQFQIKITQEGIDATVRGNDVNELMHASELLASKQSEMQHNLRESISEALHQLKAVDSMATLQVNMRNRLTEVNEMVNQFRRQIAGNEIISTIDKGNSK
ncbi:hypothetical protein [Candidatus Symbiobacter mobilis]|uniref:Uncharacterized protein n=1 Tax=Candidatus Symbiobacter mobilis CR TaxID=946483 RepID=U5NAN5_9BURK|nr:hypothetical protein [Candidatus Symbiobacter mobilis]AGX88345.1 hypothetical protein Cenrod_2283 [Candidatus Symbiobacter mobilis CR]